MSICVRPARELVVDFHLFVESCQVCIYVIVSQAAVWEVNVALLIVDSRIDPIRP